MAEDDIAAAKPNLLRLGDCFINESRTVNFLMKNYAKDGCIRFAWPEHPQLKFSSQVIILLFLRYLCMMSYNHILYVAGINY